MGFSIEQKLLSVLSHTKWKRVLELRAEIAEKFKKSPKIAALTATLELMEQQGLVESKEGDDSKILLKRNGKPYRLYRLTAGGVEHRHKIEQLKSEGDLFGRLLPETS